jgi:hypothetical protein
VTQLEADHLLSAVFTVSERKFLFNHPDFKKALAQTPSENLHSLNKTGVNLLLNGGYVPPSPEGKP